MTYNKAELIEYMTNVISEAFEVLQSLDEDSIDVRLQLVDGTYYAHIGDSQHDTNHRGNWGYTSVSRYDINDLDALAYDVVHEALEYYPVDGYHYHDGVPTPVEY